MDGGDELRGPAPAASPGLRLPRLLCARPGNVGVQIDAFRALAMQFHRPRRSAFTAQFQGVTYENHSMDNYARILERSQRRGQIVAERLDKLRRHEAEMATMEAKRRARRAEREAALSRRQWLLRQSAKRADEREGEQRAATVLQRYARGMLARRHVRRWRGQLDDDRAARCLQRQLRAYASRQSRQRRAREEEKTRRLQAARVIQRHARRRQQSRQHRLSSLHDPPAESGTPESDMETTVADRGSEVEIPPGDDVDSDAVPKPMPTPEEEDRRYHPMAASPTCSPLRPSPPPPAATGVLSVRAPRRPLSIKRVGGGFRHSAQPSASPSPRGPPQHVRPRVPRMRAPPSPSTRRALAFVPDARSSSPGGDERRPTTPRGVVGGDDPLIDELVGLLDHLE